MRSEAGNLACVQRAADWLLTKGACRPSLGVVLGSGLADALIPSEGAVTVDFNEIPGFVGPSVHGHPGRLLAGRLHGLNLIVLEGRKHLYEGLGSGSISFPFQVLAAMGARLLLLTSACGGLSSDFRPGEFVVVRDHLVYPLGGPGAVVCRISAAGSTGVAGCGRVGLSRPKIPRVTPERCGLGGALYSDRLSRALEMACLGRRVPWRRGILALAAGPCYESAAEARLLKMAGADVVSMSAAAEAVAAGSAGLEVACLCLVTNVIGLWRPLGADHRTVIKTAQDSKKTLSAALDEFVSLVARGGWAS